MKSGALRRRVVVTVTNVSMRSNKDWKLSIVFNNMKLIGNLDESSYKVVEKVKPY